jgi:hypothetical protein
MDNERVNQTIRIIADTDWSKMKPEDLENEVNYLVSIVKEEIEKALNAKEMKQENEAEWGKEMYR